MLSVTMTGPPAPSSQFNMPFYLRQPQILEAELVETWENFFSESMWQFEQAHAFSNLDSKRCLRPCVKHDSALPFVAFRLCHIPA